MNQSVPAAAHSEAVDAELGHGAVEAETRHG